VVCDACWEVRKAKLVIVPGYHLVTARCDRCGTFGSPRDFATLRAGRRHDAYSSACATCAGDQVREEVGEAARVLRAAISSKETRR
jgi:hypothetical protein